MSNKLGEMFGYLGEVVNFAASILKFVTFLHRISPQKAMSAGRDIRAVELPMPMNCAKSFPFFYLSPTRLSIYPGT